MINNVKHLLYGPYKQRILTGSGFILLHVVYENLTETKVLCNSVEILKIDALQTFFFKK
jgi:hypothetical protein